MGCCSNSIPGDIYSTKCLSLEKKKGLKSTISASIFFFSASVLRNQEKHSKLNLKQTGKKNRNNKDQRGNQYRKINEIKSWFFGKINKCSLADFVSPESTPLFRARGRVERREKEKRSYSCAEFLPRRHVGHGAFHLVPCS